MATTTTSVRKEYRAPRSRVVVNRNVTDTSYEEWKRQNGLDKPLTRAEYVQVFNPCGL